MVAVVLDPRNTNKKGGSRRFSLPGVVVILTGLFLAYLVVLLSLATTTTENSGSSILLDSDSINNGKHKKTNEKGLLDQADSKSAKENTGKALSGVREGKKDEVRKKPPIDNTQASMNSPKKLSTAAIHDAVSALHPASSATAAVRTVGPRGRSNFRNVVIPPRPSNAKKGKKPGWMEKPRGEGVSPQVIAPAITAAGGGHKGSTTSENTVEDHPDPSHVLKAFIEPIDFQEWETKPLPKRSTATADQLEELSFPKLNACSKLPEMIPVDEYPDNDPFLPWIHDVFPSHDGKFIQFVAQNRRRCHTGTTDDEREHLHLTQPNIALFQHVPIKRIVEDQNSDGQTRYRLSSHEEADADGVATRFICRFKPSMEETLSVYNFDYDYASHRKRLTNTFQYDNGGILSVHLSQFVFRCPVPDKLVDLVQSGNSVKHDWATLFVDLIPIRTPPRYGMANEFLQPRYSGRAPDKEEDRFDPHAEWGSDHMLPRIEDSGRWENIPICKPSLKTYYPPDDDNGDDTDTVNHDANNQLTEGDRGVDNTAEKGITKHRLVACMWASAGYSTRGNRFPVNDGQRRMLEWILFNKLLGFEHFYLYDNSYAFSNEATLKPIADMFPGEITYIKWPFQVCNNNPNNVDSPGERSSQYAAESSCRLRFGPHVEWIGQFDIDEYLVPMGNYTSMLPILDQLDSEGKNILSFGSWRAWPRRDYLEDPVPIQDRQVCGNNHECFDPRVPLNRTVLQTYNCDRQSGPKTAVMPAEKQLYRPDYVLQHFVHYSSVTVLSQLSRPEFEKAGYDWFKTKMAPDIHSRFTDELNEATMLHTKAVASQDTANWLDICTVAGKQKDELCRIGVPFPQNYTFESDGDADGEGWAYNCYVNQRIETYWIGRLEEALRKHQDLFGGG